MGEGLKKLGPETGATEGVRRPTGASALRSFINRKSIALLAALALMVGTGADVASAKTAKEINTSVNACLDRFYKEINGGKELAGKAKGVLVLPGVIKAGLIAGGEYGEGALRVGREDGFLL